jgi:hypothetical protein
MDAIRYVLSAMQAGEGRQMSERIERTNAIRHRDHLVVILALIVAAGTRLIAWLLFTIDHDTERQSKR